MIKKNFNDFTLEIKKQLIGERRAKKGKDLEPYYTNIAFVERDNGGVIVLSEFKLIFESGSSGFDRYQLHLTVTIPMKLLSQH